ncbi:ABC transporter ATP-binding protein [Furfurilactobacillus siliginis]|uniref:ABC transporter ATP-binding protein n=1 Tax=Furfurilactobacillus siliginis TaxID=348151 RepID=A0A0R2L477_9LACO|nr:ABC transporter ATP-binding protein [Furfurilactobacillus siliginis]KRN96418.1 ABC-type multidrug transport system, ATPase component [Furfurilactobacillus siliginis]GEK29200.1 ABC transporter ATP-binding protein [Furfurilactobacillus siliginis]
MEILTAEHLTKHYGQHIAVNDVNLHVMAGSLVAFLGPNGAGKSTTIRMLTTLSQPSSGFFTINGKNRLKDMRQDIGIVFQESVLDSRLTVRDNLRLRARLYPDVSRQRVDDLLTRVGAAEFAKQAYGSLSGGQRRRVDIARALLNKPRILFLDEPTTGLDIQTRAVIWKILQEMREQDGLTVFLTTHYLEEAEAADDVYVLDQGRIIAHGAAEVLKQQYTHSELVVWPSQHQILTIPTNWHHHFDPQHGTETIEMPSEQSPIDFLSSQQAKIQDFEYHKGSMDDVFLALTGREIRG